MQTTRIEEFVWFVGWPGTSNLGLGERHSRSPSISPKNEEYPHHRKIVPLIRPPSGVGFHNTALDAKRQKPLIFQRLWSILWIVWDVFESNLGRHDWIRTNDLFRVKEAL